MKKIILRIITIVMCILAIVLIEKLYVRDFVETYAGKIETHESITNRASWMLYALNLTYVLNEFISTIKKYKDFKTVHLLIPALFILNAVLIIFTTGIFVEVIFILINGIATLVVLKKYSNKTA